MSRLLATHLLAMILALAASGTAGAEQTAAVKASQAQMAAQARQAPLFVPGEDKRSAATRASSPERWGLQASDFSVLHDQALADKAGLPARRKEFEAAAKDGDAFAAQLAGIYHRLPMGGRNEKRAQEQFQRGAAQGLARAVADVAFHVVLNAETEEEAGDHLYAYQNLYHTPNAHGRYRFALGAIEGGNTMQGIYALNYAVAADYGPAHLALARMMVQVAKSPDAKTLQGAREHAQKALALGVADAAAFLKTLPSTPAGGGSQ